MNLFSVNTKLISMSLLTLVLSSQPLTILADPDGIIVGTDVPPQRFDGTRERGERYIINPSPVSETNAISRLLGNNTTGITEISDQQFSDITSNVNSALPFSAGSPLGDQLSNQASTQAHGATRHQLDTVSGITAGLASGIGGSVGSATRDSTDAIRDVLSDLNFGTQP